MPSALRESLFAAMIAAILAVPLIGLEAASTPTGLALHTRWGAAAVAVAAVFAGRLGLSLWRGRLPFRAALPAGFGAFAARHRVWISVAGVLFAVALPFLPFSNRYVLDTATTFLIYVMLGWGLNIVIGLAGLLDLGYVAFYAVGAYSYALLGTHFGWPFWVCLPLAGAFAALFGLVLGFPVLRLRGDYLAIVTLGFGEIIRIVLINWSNLTNGPRGIGGIPRPSFFGLPFSADPAPGTESFHTFFALDYSSIHRVAFLYFLILALALLTNLFTLRIRRLPIGRAWEALREDEIACRSLGLNPTLVKLSAFAVGAMFAGFAGSFFAARQGFISPESFSFIESAIIVAIVVLGGMGGQTGVVVAAFVLVVVPEWFREFAEYRMLLFGVAMVAIMVWRPRGLLSHREPVVRLDAPGGGP
ncbi:MAG: high-affinity branched-chain amino acid ABC transporter permease LivM [Alphaproteobacteria bacterium]|nr:high-affinity branched-chain amino acid ABC transporter permease LivM [Alphaproteobacteria bacterium]MBF0129330.1 high-affinity branched-chain amino acid ABC transporter permease LivM [Alphaproteobacteria bacterium]